MTTLQQRLDELTTVGHGATYGVRALESGLYDLAERASGVSGPIGRVAEGLALFSGGAPLVLGVAAGLGAVGLAYQAMGKEADDAAAAVKRHQDALDHLTRSRESPSDRAGIDVIAPSQSDLAKLQAELVELQQKQEAGVTTVRDPSSPLFPSPLQPGRPLTIPIEERIHQVLQEVTNRQNELVVAQTGYGIGPGKPIALPPVRAEPDELRAPSAASLSRGIFQVAPQAAAFNDVFGIDDRTPGPPTEGTVRGVSIDPRTGLPRGTYGAEELTGHYAGTGPKGDDHVDYRRIASAGLEFAAAARHGGGPAPFLEAAGGVASAIPGGQVVGAAAEGAGALLSLLQSGKAKFTISDLDQQAVDKLHREPGLPGATSIVIVGGGSTSLAALATALVRVSNRYAAPSVPYAVD